MNCTEMSEFYELYALGVLEGTEKEAVEEHLAQNCEFCAGKFSRALETNAMVFRAVPEREPSRQLRSRLLAGFGIEHRPYWVRGLPWTVAALATMIMMYALMPRESPAGARNGRETDATALDFLGTPGTRQVSFGSGAGSPHGSLLVQQEKGLLLVVVNLPAAPAGKMYETWVVPRQGNPRPMGILTAAKGESVALIPGPFDANDLKAVAVSIEPAATTPPAAPTRVLFAAPLN